MNKYFGKGRLTKEPEVRVTSTSKTVATFTLAVNDYGDKAYFFPCQAWGKTAELIGDTVRKGQEILIEGHLVVETYEKEGKKRSITKIIVDRFEYCGSKGKEASSAGAMGRLGAVEEDVPF